MHTAAHEARPGGELGDPGFSDEPQSPTCPVFATCALAVGVQGRAPLDWSSHRVSTLCPKSHAGHCKCPRMGVLTRAPSRASCSPPRWLGSGEGARILPPATLVLDSRPQQVSGSHTRVPRGGDPMHPPAPAPRLPGLDSPKARGACSLRHKHVRVLGPMRRMTGNPKGQRSCVCRRGPPDALEAARVLTAVRLHLLEQTSGAQGCSPPLPPFLSFF